VYSQTPRQRPSACSARFERDCWRLHTRRAAALACRVPRQALCPRARSNPTLSRTERSSEAAIRRLSRAAAAPRPLISRRALAIRDKGLCCQPSHPPTSTLPLPLHPPPPPCRLPLQAAEGAVHDEDLPPEYQRSGRHLSGHPEGSVEPSAHHLQGECTPLPVLHSLGRHPSSHCLCCTGAHEAGVACPDTVTLVVWR
jgi:hypothetical protein